VIDPEEFEKLVKKSNPSHSPSSAAALYDDDGIDNFVHEDDDFTERGRDMGCGGSPTYGTDSAELGDQRLNLASFSQKDVGDKSLPQNSTPLQSSASGGPDGTGNHKGQSSRSNEQVGSSGSVSGSCACGCCKRVLKMAAATQKELHDLRAEVADLKVEFRSETASLKSEFSDLKELLLKALKK
jgi:hypothetical protein